MEQAVDCGLKPEVTERIKEVFRGFPQIDRVVLYGSRAKGTFRNGSDIDLTIMLKPEALTIIPIFMRKLRNALMTWTLYTVSTCLFSTKLKTRRWWITLSGSVFGFILNCCR